MNYTFAISSLFIVAAAVSIILINFMINLSFRKKLEFDDSNKSFNLFKAGNIISFFIVFINLKTPFEHFVNNTTSLNLGKDILFQSVSYFVLFLFIFYILHFLNHLIANFLFKIITNGTHFIESIKENKTENIILFISITICLSFVIQNHVADILDLLIPYPKTPIFR
jgi:hypothetical protein